MRRVYRALAGVSILAAIGLGIAWVIRQTETTGIQQPAPELQPRGSTAYQTVTGDDSEDDRSRWDKLYDTKTYIYGKEPALFLRENIQHLPLGRALDIAMGEGRNAVYLAKKGYQVEGVDLSDIAIRKAKLLARENHVSIDTVNADLNHYFIKPDTYDVILNIDYLQKNLIPQIKKGLKHGGVVVFQNYTVDQLNNSLGQQVPKDFLLEKGELKELFADLEVIVYRETNDGKEALASLIARRR